MKKPFAAVAEKFDNPFLIAAQTSRGTLMVASERHSKATIISMAVLASATATLLHEGIGHGLIAWLRGDIPTELTSNHLSSLRPDHWVEAGGSLANLMVGFASLLLSRAEGSPANLRYFLWILAALNLLPGAGYFVFQGSSASETGNR